MANSVLRAAYGALPSDNHAPRYHAPAARRISRFNAPAAREQRIDAPAARSDRFRAPTDNTGTKYSAPGARSTVEFRA
jgi:hypothetical protein